MIAQYTERQGKKETNIERKKKGYKELKQRQESARLAGFLF